MGGTYKTDGLIRNPTIINAYAADGGYEFSERYDTWGAVSNYISSNRKLHKMMEMRQRCLTNTKQG